MTRKRKAGKRRQRQAEDAAPKRARTVQEAAHSEKEGEEGAVAALVAGPQGPELPDELQKYWRQRHRFFWRFDQGIQIDEEGWFSVTPEIVAESTAARIAQLHNSRAGGGGDEYGRICVVDAFCGVGGNAIKFASWCELVIAIDIDAGRLAMARHNAEVYGVADRIEFVLGDFYALAPMLRADVVFMSPPWGGPEYTNAPVFDLDSLPFHTAQEWLDRARLVSSNIAYFMPRNSDPRQLAALFPKVACDIELNYTNGFLKALTAYYGDLALFGRTAPRVLT